MRRPISIIVVAIAIGVSPTLSRAEKDSAPNAEIARLIEQLDDASFAARETAEQRLFEIGVPAITPLAAAADDTRLEVTNRATNLLLKMYQTGKPETRDQIDDILDRLALSERASSSRRAKAAVDSVSALRHKRALTRLVELKAIIDTPLGDVTPIEDALQVDVWLDNQWQGGVEGLDWLKRLNKIHTLYFVEGCPVPEEAVLELERTMTGLGVQTRGEACLGLRANSDVNELGVVVNDVSPGGSIESAGLRRADIITKYEGEKMETFDQLVKRIRKDKTGSTVTVEYLRGGKTQTAEVKLKSWREVIVKSEQPRATSKSRTAPRIRREIKPKREQQPQQDNNSSPQTKP